MSHDQRVDFDVIVIGAGFSGIYALHKLRNGNNLRVRLFEKGDGVGGTWYWNRYPGARADTDSLVYRYSFDEETSDGWNWNARYVSQPEMRAYLEAVVERHDLGRDIQLETRIGSLVYDDASGTWTAATDRGERFTSRYVVTALGVLSKAHIPDLAGIERFEGRLVHTTSWPPDLTLDGRRVGVIGTGSTGTQLIVAAARTAQRVTVFQRSAQFCVPAGQRELSDEQIASYRANYEQIWNDIRSTRIACGFTESDVAAMSVSADERQRVFEESWNIGNGFRFMFGTFSDIAVDPAANQAAADFIRSKIRQIVKDPQTADALMPSDLYAKRPIGTDDYYETYNRDNVMLVDLKRHPITEVTAAGVRTADGREHELDVLVFATGFEAVEGSYNQMVIQGRCGETIRDHWRERPSSYLGMAVSGFPNMFMVLGPNSVFSNLAPGIETQVEWIADLVRAADEGGNRVVEATGDAERAWSDACDEIAHYTLFPSVKSWIFGANVPGTSNRVLFYFGGLASYRERLGAIADDGYTGFVLSGAPQPAVA